MAEEGQTPRKPFKTISLVDKLKASEYDKVSDKKEFTSPSITSQNPDLDSVKSNPSIPTTKKEDQSPQVNERGELQDKSGQSPEVEGIPTSNNPQGSPEVSQSETTQNKETQSPEVEGIPTSQNKDSDQISLPLSQLTLPKEGAVLKDTVNLAEKTSPILKTLADSPQAQIDPPRPFETLSLIGSDRPTGFTNFASSISLEDRLKQSKVTQTRHLPQYFLSDLYTGYLTITPFITPPIDDQDIGQIPDFLTEALEETQNVGELATPTEDVLNRQDPDIEIQPRKEDGVILTRQGTFISNNIVNSIAELTAPKTTAQILQGEIELPIYNVVVDQGITEDEQIPLGDVQIAVLQGMIVENSQIQGSVLELTEFESLQIENLPIPEDGQISVDQFNEGKNQAFETPLAFHGTVELGTAQYDEDKEQSVSNPLARHGTAELSVNEFLVSRTLAFGSPAVFHGTEIVRPFEPQDPGVLPASAPDVDSTPYQPEANIPLPPEYAGLNTNKYTDANPIKGAGNQNPNAHTPDVQSPPPVISHAAALRSARSSQDSGTLFMEFRDTDNNKIRLEPYLTSFSDGLTANWNDVNYAGRMDTLKSYTGTTRALSFAILLPAFNKSEQEANMKKLEELVNMCVVGKIFNDVYVKSPLVRVRIGGLINSWCAFSSVKWDFDPAETTWAADTMGSKNTQLPSLFKVQFDCAVLSRNDGKLLDAAKGGYFAKTWI